MITDPREIAKTHIAQILDHPSVYMGGPSQRSLKIAERILIYLESEEWVAFPSTEQQP